MCNTSVIVNFGELIKIHIITARLISKMWLQLQKLEQCFICVFITGVYYPIFFFKPDFTIMGTHSYLQKFHSNILELCGLCIHIIWRMLQVYKISWMEFAANFSNFYLPKPDVHYLNIWRKINVFKFQCFGFFLSKVHVCICLGKKPPFILFTSFSLQTK